MYYYNNMYMGINFYRKKKTVIKFSNKSVKRKKSYLKIKLKKYYNTEIYIFFLNEF